MSTPDVIIYKISKIIYKYRPLFFGAEFEAEFEIYITRAAFRKDYRKTARARIARAIIVILCRRIVKGYADGLLKDYFPPYFARINFRNTFFAHRSRICDDESKFQFRP